MPTGFPVVSSVGAWCQMLGHHCDGVDGACNCSCHATNERAIATLTQRNEGRPSAG